MKYIIGMLFIIAGVLGGIYLGLWVMFVGGILAIAKAIDTHMITSTLIAINLIKIFLSSVVGYLVAMVGICIGTVIAGE